MQFITLIRETIITHIYINTVIYFGHLRYDKLFAQPKTTQPQY